MSTRPYALVTFDVYSALFDINGSLLPLLRRHLQLPQERAQSLLQAWRKTQLQYTLINSLLQKGHVSFRVVTRRALDVVLHRWQLDVSESEREALVASWDRLSPRDDAHEALRSVQAQGYPLGLLSNGDEAMLQSLAQQLEVPVDFIFSAEQAQIYKPHPAIYHLPVEAMKVAPGRILHVAGSGRDVMGAKAAGLTCAWRNPGQERILDPAYQADFEAGDLITLLQMALPH